ncbi:MAG: PBP1A family penicillin-binding protein [Longimicrobiales bacterium]|nr:PBP1A family penicillin-binding protein [Longimicrobiales bacterium]
MALSLRLLGEMKNHRLVKRLRRGRLPWSSGRSTPRYRRRLARGLVVVAALGWFAWVRCGVAGCPDAARLASWAPGGASVLLARNGEPFADLSPVDHPLVPLDSLPEHIGDAFVAVEDRRFFRHGGVDWFRVVGAVSADLRAGAFVQGASTLTMQLARTLFPERIRRSDRTLSRKLLEVRMAGEIEERFTKAEILELYLNHIYLGGGAEGVQGASRYYFGKDARDLAVEEAALLAALAKAPALYDPYDHPEAARARRDLVLDLMADQARLPVEEARAARARPVRLLPEPALEARHTTRFAPYFVEEVRRFLEGEMGERIHAERFTIHTTLEIEAQTAAEEELRDQLRAVESGAFGRFRGPSYRHAPAPEPGGTAYLQGAVIVLDLAGGEIRAWVGGRDFADSRFDRARHARRQAGSAFKPFVYAAAIEEGFVLSQPILDAPFRLAEDDRPAWAPGNYSGDFEGPMRLREALVRSQNLPAIRLAAAVGPRRIRDFARRAAMTGEVPLSPVSALGVSATSPLEMAVAYSAFAGEGARVAPRVVTRVEDADGRVVFETEAERTEVTDPATAFLMTDLLREVVRSGTGAGVRSAGFQGPAAGKTGTTDDATDLWFAGYTPEVVGVVWVGFDAARPLPVRSTGGSVAAPVWGRIMSRIHRGRAMPRWGDPPPDVVTRAIDPGTGMLLEAGCRPRSGDPQWEFFVVGNEPVARCPHRGDGGFLSGFGHWLGSVFGSSDPTDRIPGEADPDLGLPRLPVGPTDVSTRTSKAHAGRR